VLRIQLDFKGDISEIYKDLIIMLKNIKSNKEKFEIYFLSSSFTAIWYFTLFESKITIKPKWTSLNLFLENAKIDASDYFAYEDEIIIDKSIFKSEWDKVLKIIKSDLEKSGYKDSLEGYSYLKDL